MAKKSRAAASKPNLAGRRTAALTSSTPANKQLRLLIYLLLLCVFGSAQAAFFADDDARKGVAELKQQAVGLQAKLDEANAARQALEKRVTELDAAMKGQAVDMLGQIDRLNAEISKLRGQLEVNSHEIGLAQQRQRDLYTDLDGRLRKLESGASAKPGDAEAPGAASPVVAPTPAPSVDAAGELKSYEAAHELFKAGKYKESAEAFEKFLEAYPGSKYAPSSQYWIGYAHFSQKNYKAAIASQQKLIKLYPDNQKVPDAMYNIANSQIQLSDVEGAKQTLRGLLEKYPQSEAAPLAKKRLAALESVKPKN
jgi:tol-pal system protein YbgF